MAIDPQMIFRARKLFDGIPAKYILIIVILSFSLNKIQPFSTFPLYSHIPATAEYYYVTDEKDAIIPLRLRFQFSGGDLHKMIEYRYLKYSNTYGNPEILSKVGEQTLEYMFTTFNITSRNVSYKTLKVWNAKVSMVDKKIKVVSTEIAKKQVL